MIKPKFTIADVRKHLENRMRIIEEETLMRLRRLGEECVIKAKSNSFNLPEAFPATYTGQNAKPLRQRHINERDREKNPAVSEPAFGDFLDQTAALRNSIGYAIIKDGVVLESHYGSKETSTSANIARAAAASIRKGYGLVVIAGMSYASHVEAQGLDVISSSELFAKRELPKLLAKLKKAVSSKK